MGRIFRVRRPGGRPAMAPPPPPWCDLANQHPREMPGNISFLSLRAVAVLSLSSRSSRESCCLPLRLVHALDACAEAKVRNVAPEWRLRKAQREMNRCRRLIQASHKSAVKKIQIGQPQKSARSCLKQLDLIRAQAEIAIVDDRTITLALSESRAYDSALEIRGAYKLTGNFH